VALPAGPTRFIARAHCRRDRGRDELSQSIVDGRMGDQFSRTPKIARAGAQISRYTLQRRCPFGQISIPINSHVQNMAPIQYLHSEKTKALLRDFLFT
jgi:hypothetical protein